MVQPAKWLGGFQAEVRQGKHLAPGDPQVPWGPHLALSWTATNMGPNTGRNLVIWRSVKYIKVLIVVIDLSNIGT